MTSAVFWSLFAIFLYHLKAASTKWKQFVVCNLPNLPKNKRWCSFMLIVQTANLRCLWLSMIPRFLAGQHKAMSAFCLTELLCCCFAWVHWSMMLGDHPPKDLCHQFRNPAADTVRGSCSHSPLKLFTYPKIIREQSETDRQADTVCYDGCLVLTQARELLLGGEIIQMALAISVTYQPKSRAWSDLN